MKPHRKPLGVIAAVIALITLSLLTTACKGVEITEKQVSDMLDEMEVAAKKRDFNRLCSFMSEKVKIKHTLEGAGQSATKTFTREEYRKEANNMMKVVDGYEYACTNRKIMISRDGLSAYAVEEIHETVSIAGNSITAVSIGSTTFGLEDGKLVVTAVEAKGQVEQAGPVSRR